jgi:hypothetical protein
MVVASATAVVGQSRQLFESFQSPPDDARIMMRWWWFGPAVTRTQIDRELELMKAGGIGGVEVQPVYPVALDDPERGFRNLAFLSEEFSAHLRHASESAKRLGLRFDLTLGSGWPYGGPEIPVTLAAGRLKRVVVSKPPFALPDMGNGEKLVAAFADAGEGLKAFDPAVGPAAGAKAVEYYVASRTGQMVKRASVGAEGFVLDHYNRAALDAYLARTGSKLMDAVKGAKPAAIFCDSLEAFGSDWTGDLPEEFKRRRGYDLIPLLPRLAEAGSNPETRAIRHDWGLTLTELAEERFIEPMQAFSRRHGVQFRIQGYGIPPATMSTNRLVDLPEGEGPEWKTLRASRWASSASHLYGKQATSSETWTWLHSPAFAAAPLDMKAEADRHFLQGITQLIGHGWPYTAEGVEYPGWRFYASAVFDDKNPWWIVMPDVSRYLQRVTHLLRQGRAANSVALYLPNHDAWGDFRIGHVHMIEVLKERVGPAVIPAVLDAGYGLDFFDDAAAGRLGEGGHKIVVLPAVETMPAESLKKLKALASTGVTVLATRRLPDRAPGYMTTAAQHDEVGELARSFVRCVKDEAALPAAMRAAVAPELAIEPATAGVGFIRRELPDADVYFIANTSNRRQSGTLKPRSKWTAAQWWDPMTGASRGAGTLPVAFDLAPYESRALVLGAGPAAARREWTEDAKPLELGGEWTLRLPGEGQPRRLAAVQPWTALPGLLHYSGVAEYEKSFALDKAAAGGGEAMLDFGEGVAMQDSGKGPGMRALLEPPIREAAEVWVNGQRAGTLWAPPYRIAVARLLRAGENRIRIRVANTAINHMAGRPLPDYRLLNSRFGTRFEPQDMNKVHPAPSGLTGPVRLVFLRSQQ